MMNFKDNELTEEELSEIYAGLSQGKFDETLDKLSKEELKELKDNVNERELTEEELDNVKAGIPKEMVDEMIEKNSDLFRHR